jgi:phage terminase small subunit
VTVAKSKIKRVRKPPPRAEPFELNARQLAFTRAWFSGPTMGNATASARAAGYTGSDHVVETTGSRLLRHPGVVAQLASLRKLAECDTVADAKERLLILSSIVRGTRLTTIGVHEGTAVAGPPKASDITRAAELIARTLGELREPVDMTITGPAGGPIQVQHVPPAVARAELLARLVAQVGADEAERMVRVLLGEPEPVAMIEAPKESA